MATELAVGYVSIVPETRKLEAGIRAALTNASRNMQFSPTIDPRAGQRAGQAFNQGFRSNVRLSDAIMSGAPMQQVGDRMGSMLGNAMKASVMGIVGGMGLSLGAVAFKGFDRIVTLDRTKAQLENASKSMQKFGKDALDVVQIMNDVKGVVEGTPIALDAAFSQVPQLIAMGIKPGEQLIGVMKGIADAAGQLGTPDAFNRVAMGVQNVLNQGKLQQQDLQTWFSGLPLGQWLSESMSLDQSTINQMITDGKIGIREVMQALQAHTAGLAKDLGNTVEGAMSNMTTAAARVSANFIAAIFGTDQIGAGEDMAKTIGQVTDKFDDMSDWVNANRGEIHDFFTNVGDVAGDLATAVDGATDAVGGLGNALKILGTIWAGLKIGGWALSIRTAFAAAGAAGGVGAAGAGAGAAGGAALGGVAAAAAVPVAIIGVSAAAALGLQQLIKTLFPGAGENDKPPFLPNMPTTLNGQPVPGTMGAWPAGVPRPKLTKDQEMRLQYMGIGPNTASAEQLYKALGIPMPAPAPAGPTPTGIGSGISKSPTTPPAGDTGWWSDLPSGVGAGGSGELPAPPRIPFPAGYGSPMGPGETPEQWKARMDQIESEHAVAEAQARVDQLRGLNLDDESDLIVAENALQRAKLAQLEQRQKASGVGDIAVPFPSGYGAPPLPGMTPEQYSQQQNLLEAVHNRQQAEAELKSAQDSGIASASQLIDLQNKLGKARSDENEALLRLNQTTTQFGSNVSSVTAQLDQDFGMSRGIPGIVDNLVKLLGGLAAAPISGLMSGLTKGLQPLIPEGWAGSASGNTAGGAAGVFGGVLDTMFNGAANAVSGGLPGGAGPGGQGVIQTPAGPLTFDQVDKIAASYGLKPTSELRPGDKGFHGSGRATDYSGSPDAMAAFSQYMSENFGPGISELIHDAPGFSGNIKNGANVGAFGGFYNNAQAGRHDDHTHLALPTPRGMPPGPGTLAFPAAGASFAGGSPQDAVRSAMLTRWPESEWGALNSLITRESSWDPNAKNPSSGAFGLFQFLGHENDAYGAAGGYSPDPTQQANAGMQYIADRYGSPSAAWNHWQQNNSYEQGGAIPIMAHAGEHVLTADDVSAMGGQQGVYNFRNALHYATGGAVMDFLGLNPPSQPPPTPTPVPSQPATPAGPTPTPGVTVAPPFQAPTQGLAPEQGADPRQGLGAPPPLGGTQTPGMPHLGTGAPPGPPQEVSGKPPGLPDDVAGVLDDILGGKASQGPGDITHQGTGAPPGPPDAGKTGMPDFAGDVGSDLLKQLAGFIPQAAKANRVSGTSNISRIWMTGADLINGLIEEGGALASTAISAAISSGVAAAGSSGFSPGASAAGAPAGAAASAASQFLIGMATQAAERGVSYVAQLGGIWSDATIEQMFPFGAPHWIGFDSAKDTMSSVGALTDSRKKAGLFDDGGWLQPNSAGVNLTNQPEAVLTGQQWEALNANGVATPNGGATYNVYASDMNEAMRTLQRRERINAMQYTGRPTP